LGKGDKKSFEINFFITTYIKKLISKDRRNTILKGGIL